MRQDYRLLEGIGRGSYSCVYKVENIHTGDICCAKNVLFHEMIKSSIFRKKTLMEDFWI